MKPEIKLVEAEVTQEVPKEATPVKVVVVEDKSNISFGARSGPTSVVEDERAKMKRLEKKIEKKMDEISVLRGEINKCRKRISLYEKAQAIQ